jgi:hypothetical protein
VSLVVIVYNERVRRHASRPVLVALATALCACDSATIGGPTDGLVGDRPDRGPSADGPRADRAWLDGPRRESSVDPCSPLPAGCLCAQACNAGACDNSLCPCPPIAGVAYGKIAIAKPTSGDMSKHGDVNLLLRQRQSVAAQKGLVDISGPTDTKPPPQLYSLFSDDRVPVFPTVYRLQSWDWGCNCAGPYMTSPEVTLAGMQTKTGEEIRTPMSGYDIGGGRTAVVLYAAKGTITLKYTGEDNVVYGYTVHLSGICVDPSLQALYDQLSAAGRKELPALTGRQPLGRALSTEIQAAIRDTGSWMDPRSRKDWWQGK